MANPNNLIRPPVLNTTENPQPAQRPLNPDQNPIHQFQPQPRIISSAELVATVTDIVRSVLKSQSEVPVVQDQTINPESINDLGDLEKIPEIVRSLRDFSGKPGEFSSWRKSVERVLQIYEPTRGSPKYYGILNVIRNKIIGNADAVLESYNTPLDWRAICKCLTLHYADQRDLGTLEYQMTSLIQGSAPIQEFYQSVYTQLSLILNKISSMDVGPESLSLLTSTYRDKALDTFIRGLNGDLPRLLAMREPTSLPQALNLCQKLENQNFRSQYATNHHNNQRKYQQTTSHLPTPPLRHILPQRIPVQRQHFYPELAYLPQPQYPRYNNFSNRLPQQFGNNNLGHVYPNFALPRPPKPQPKPEPMETSTIKSSAINYQNRPQPFRYAGKRIQNPSIQNRVPPKVKRNFHINIDNPNPNPTNNPPNFPPNHALQPSEYVSPNDLYAFYDQTDTEEIEHNPEVNNYIWQQQVETVQPKEEIELDQNDINFLD